MHIPIPNDSKVMMKILLIMSQITYTESKGNSNGKAAQNSLYQQNYQQKVA